MSIWLGAVLVGVGVCAISFFVVNWIYPRHRRPKSLLGKIALPVLIGYIGAIIFFLILTFNISGLMACTRNYLNTYYEKDKHICRCSEETKAYKRGDLVSVPTYQRTFGIIIDPAIAKLHLEITIVPGKDDESIRAQYERIISHGDTLEAYVRRLTFLYEYEPRGFFKNNFPGDYIQFLKPLLKIVGVKEFRIFVAETSVTTITQIE